MINIDIFNLPTLLTLLYYLRIISFCLVLENRHGGRRERTQNGILLSSPVEWYLHPRSWL